MSGILGVWNLDGRPMDDDLLSGMSAMLQHRALDGEHRSLVGSIGFVHHHRWVTSEEIGEAQPLESQTGVMLVMDGRLDNRDELLAALPVRPASSDAACVLAAYEAWGDRFVERLNGDFAIGIFDPRQRRLLLARDPVGLRPLYYFRNHRLLAFASEIKSLLAHPDVPIRADNEGIADFLLIGSRPADRQEVTCFADISAIVPAHVMVITPERAVARRYWDFDVSRPVRLRSFDEYVEAFRERFAQAVRRRTRSAFPVVVSLSGGLDSSSIFCQAEQSRRSGAAGCPRLIGISYAGLEGTDADERQYLLEIEREYGVEIERFPMEPFLGLVRGAETQIRAIEAPFVDYLWGVTEELHRRAAVHGARLILSGTWGDQVLFSSAYLVDLFRQPAWRTVWSHLREYGQWYGDEEARILRRRFAASVVRHHVPDILLPPLKWIRRRLVPAGRAQRWFSKNFLRGAHRFADQPVRLGDGFHSAQARSIYFEARSKYHVHCMEWNNKIAALHKLEAALPFLDRDLLAFLMAIPGEVQNRNGVPRALLREAMRGILPEPLRTRTWKANFSSEVNRGLAQDVDVVTRALSSESLAVRLGYLDEGRLGPEVAKLSAGLARPNCIDSWSLADLFGLEVWLQVFFGDRSARAFPVPSPVKESVG